jgi:hypothetical protein
MDKGKQTGYSFGYYALGALGITGIIGGLYYLFQAFNEEPVSEETTTVLEQMKQDVELKGGELTPEVAIKIMALTNKQAEEFIKKAKPDIDDRRRAAINDRARYDQICQEYFESKENAYQAATNIILKKFGNISMEDIQAILSTVSPYELERKTFEVDKPIFDGHIPDKQKVKEIFKYYGNELSLKMREFHMNMSRFQGDPNMQEYLIFGILILKVRVDDELFLKYNYTEAQIRYLLYHHDLINDPEIKEVNDKISRFEDFMN